jgi:hypothetical protein
MMPPRPPQAPRPFALVLQATSLQSIQDTTGLLRKSTGELQYTPYLFLSRRELGGHESQQASNGCRL